jgi:hypothetical protein
VYLDSVSNVNILNNTFAFQNPYRTGHIRFASPISSSLIANNIFYQPLTGGIDYGGSTPSNVEVKNNLAYGGTVHVGTPPAGISSSGNIDNANPLVVNTSTVPYDFHLQSGSPAIDAGATLSAVPELPRR